jgi:hypothetical protein
MKNAKVKSLLVILGTLLIGMVLGAMIAGHMIHKRVRDFMEMRSGERFEREIREAADPTADQERLIRPILAAFAERLDSMHAHHLVELKENMSLLEMSLEEYLQPDQMEKVRKKLRRMEGRHHKHGEHGGHGGRHRHGHGDD